MTSIELILPILIASLVFSGFMIRLFRNNWKQPFASLTRRVDDLETKQLNIAEKHEKLETKSTKELEDLFTQMTNLRSELAMGIKTLEREYSEAIGDSEDKTYRKLDDCTRQIEKLNDRFIDVSRDLITIARSWNDPQNFRIQK